MRLLLLILLCPALACARPVEVVAVYDGDSFTANVPGWPPIVGERIGVRVRGVDTPELRGRCQGEIEAARAAKRFTVEKLRGARVVDLQRIERGKYFRLIAEVWVDGQRLDLLLIQAGHGYPYFGGKRRGWCD